jgi:small subunit ribosomal protein S1
MDEQNTQPDTTAGETDSMTGAPGMVATGTTPATDEGNGANEASTAPAGAVAESPNGHDVPEAQSEAAAPVPTPAPVAESAPNAENDMAALLAASDEQFRQLKYGDVIEGTVMRKDPDEILVDIGSKSEGIIPSNELSSLTSEEFARLAIGDEVLVSVLQPEDKEGHVVLSLDRARQEKSWRKLQKQFENNEIIEAEVNGYNKGGLLVNLEGVRGFVPASQVTGLSSGGTDAAKQSELSRFTGQKLPLKIIEINRNRNRLILSERQAAQEQRDARKEQLLAELQPGQIREGHVSSICDFGAFVDIGGADGLIHLSELSWSRVNHPSEVLKVGQPVRVYVMSVDERDRKIALSLKRTQPEPWSQVMEHYQLGQLVRGTITQLTDFGAFARLEDGIEGLIHVSELAEGRVTHPRNVVQEGWELTLRVIRIDPQRRRMGLSLKRAMEPQEGDTLPPQEPLPVPTPRVAGEGDQGGRGGRGGQGGRGGANRGRGREEEQAGGGEATAQAEAPPPQPQPVAPAPEPDLGDTAMAQAMTAARAAAASETAEAEAPVNSAEPAGSAPDEAETDAGETVTPSAEAETGAGENVTSSYEAETGAGENVTSSYEAETGIGENGTPAGEAEGDDTGTAT